MERMIQHTFQRARGGAAERVRAARARGIGTAYEVRGKEGKEEPLEIITRPIHHYWMGIEPAVAKYVVRGVPVKASKSQEEALDMDFDLPSLHRLDLVLNLEGKGIIKLNMNKF
ncbi:hypothetical protein Tco_0324235 [Tanacetum coccineum]